MKLVIKLAAVGTILASTIVAASAQGTGRPGYDQPSRFWNAGPMAGPSYYGEGYGYGTYGYNDPTDYRSGSTDSNIWAYPGSQEQRDIGNAGG